MRWTYIVSCLKYKQNHLQTHYAHTQNCKTLMNNVHSERERERERSDCGTSRDLMVILESCWTWDLSGTSMLVTMVKQSFLHLQAWFCGWSHYGCFPRSMYCKSSNGKLHVSTLQIRENVAPPPQEGHHLNFEIAYLCTSFTYTHLTVERVTWRALNNTL